MEYRTARMPRNDACGSCEQLGIGMKKTARIMAALPLLSSAWNNCRAKSQSARLLYLDRIHDGFDRRHQDDNGEHTLECTRREPLFCKGCTCKSAYQCGNS